MQEINSLQRLIPHLQTAQLSDLSLDDNNQVIYKKDSKTQSLENTEKIKTAFLSFVQGIPTCKEETLEHEIQVLSQNKLQLEFLEKLKSNSDLVNDLFIIVRTLSDSIEQHKEFQGKMFEVVFKHFNKELQQDRKHTSEDEVNSIKRLGEKLTSFTDDIQIKDQIKKATSEFIKQFLAKVISEQLPLLNKQIVSMPAANRNDLLSFLEKTSNYLNSFFPRKIPDLKKAIELFLSASKIINNFKDESLKKEINGFDKKYIQTIYSLVLICGNNENDLFEILSHIKSLEGLGIEKIKLYSRLNSIIDENKDTPECKKNIKYILSVYTKFYKDNKKLFPIPDSSTLLQQAQLIDKVPEINYLLKSHSVSLAEFYIDKPEHLRSVIKLISQLPSDAAESLLSALELDWVEVSIGRFKHEQYSQFMEILYLLSVLPKDVSDVAIPPFTRWLKEAPINLLPFTFRLFTDRVFATMDKDVNQILKLAEKTKAEKDILPFKNELHSDNEELFNFLFVKPQTPLYWEKHQKTLQGYPKLVKPFETWLSKLALLDESNIKNWPNAMANINSEFKDLLSKLFELELSNPNLFQRIISVSVQSESSRTLDILISVLKHYPISSFLALLQQLELHPDLIFSPPQMFERKEGSPLTALSFNNFTYQTDTLLNNLFKLDANTLYVILKEKDMGKRDDIYKTFIQDRKKLQKILEIDTPVPIIWRTSKDLVDSIFNTSYSSISSELVDHIYQASPATKDRIIQMQSKVSIPWDQVPSEILSIDPELPLQVTELCERLKVSNFNIRLLLEEAVLKGSKAKIYCMLKIPSESRLINSQFYEFISQLPPDDPIGKAFIFLFSADKNIKVLDSLSFLYRPEWSEFSNVISNFERIYDLQIQGTIEDRLNALPVRLKRNLLLLMHKGLKYPNLIKPMCNLISNNPQMPFLEFLIKSFQDETEENCLHLMQCLIRIPLKGQYLPIDTESFKFLGFKNILIQLSKKQHLDKDPELLIHILKLSEHVYSYSVMLGENPDLFFKMIQLDKRLGPPYGIIVSSKFDKDTSTSLVSNPLLAITVRQVGLQKIDKELLDKLGDAFLYMLQINPSHPGIEIIESNQTCTDALKNIDLSLVVNPQKYIGHVLTIASWREVDSLIFILEWMEKDNYLYGEHLLDMAAAGYLPEALAIIHNPQINYAELLEQPGSVIGTTMQKVFQKLPEEETKEFHASEAPKEAMMKIRVHMEQIKKNQFKDDAQKARAIETAFSFALADAMISADGHLSVIPFDQLIPLMDFPKDSDFGIYLRKVISYIESDKGFSEILDQVKITVENNSPVAKIVAKMFDLPAGTPLTDRHAKVAALSAILTRARQSSNVGSCFGTSCLIISQSDKDVLKKSLEDYQYILANNGLMRADVEENSYSYPINMSTKKISETILDENLLLKAREKILASMGAQAKLGATQGGLMSHNLKHFDEDSGYYQKKMEQFKTFIVVPLPIDTKIVLDEFRRVFLHITKAVVEYEEPHPITDNLGWWFLARRDKLHNIQSSTTYQELHTDVVEMTRKAILIRYPDHAIYLSRLFNYLEAQTKDSSFIGEISSYGNPDLQKDNLWRKDSGGYAEAVLETDLQYIGENLFISFFGNTPEEVLHHFIQYCDSMPLKVKLQFIQEPERLSPLRFPGHAFCFKPSELISLLSSGKSEADILEELGRTSGIHMKDIEESRKKEFFENWIKKLPQSLQIPFKKEIDGIDFNNMSFEEFGTKLMEILGEVFRLEPPYNLIVKLEDLLLSLLTPEMTRKIPSLILADLNWNRHHYNNNYLACGRSLLTGKLGWYICDRYGTNLVRYSENLAGRWSFMQPIIRTEKGHLTYKKLTV